jgi:hypothetical protein
VDKSDDDTEGSVRLDFVRIPRSVTIVDTSGGVSGLGWAVRG